MASVVRSFTPCVKDTNYGVDAHAGHAGEPRLPQHPWKQAQWELNLELPRQAQGKRCERGHKRGHKRRHGKGREHARGAEQARNQTREQAQIWEPERARVQVLESGREKVSRQEPRGQARERGAEQERVPGQEWEQVQVQRQLGLGWALEQEQLCGDDTRSNTEA